MYADPSGHSPKWWQWALFGVGVALVAVAAGMAFLGTGGIAGSPVGAIQYFVGDPSWLVML